MPNSSLWLKPFRGKPLSFPATAALLSIKLIIERISVLYGKNFCAKTLKYFIRYGAAIMPDFVGIGKAVRIAMSHPGAKVWIVFSEWRKETI